MPVSADIYSQIQQPRPFEPAANPLLALSQAYQIKGMQNQLDASERTTQTQNRLADLLRSSYDPVTGAMDTNKMRSGLAQAGDYAGLTTFEKTQADQAKAQRDADKARLETGLKHFEVVGQIMNGVKDQSSLDAARQQAASIFGADAAKNIPTVYDPAVIARNQAQAMSVKDQLQQQYQQLTFGETQRHNRATEGTAAGALQNNRDRLAFDQNQPRGQVVQTDSGTMLVDPRSGEARPVTAGGVPVQRPGKDIPATANTAIMENKQTVTTLDRAIALLEGKDVGDQKGDQNATGWKGYLPNGVLNRLDPKGVDARAEISDIGSLKIHDRSGAAVTLSEAPRLMPFIPLATDDRETALKKLKRLKVEADNAGLILGETYSKDQGYRESPLLSGKSTPKATPTASAPPAAAIAHLKANPALRPQFEAKYGQSADAYLGK